MAVKYSDLFDFAAEKIDPYDEFLQDLGSYLIETVNIQDLANKLLFERAELCENLDPLLAHYGYELRQGTFDHRTKMKRVKFTGGLMQTLEDKFRSANVSKKSELEQVTQGFLGEIESCKEELSKLTHNLHLKDTEISELQGNYSTLSTFMQKMDEGTSTFISNMNQTNQQSDQKLEELTSLKSYYESQIKTLKSNQIELQNRLQKLQIDNKNSKETQNLNFLNFQNYQSKIEKIENFLVEKEKLILCAKNDLDQKNFQIQNQEQKLWELGEEVREVREGWLGEKVVWVEQLEILTGDIARLRVVKERDGKGADGGGVGGELDLIHNLEDNIMNATRIIRLDENIFGSEGSDDNDVKRTMILGGLTPFKGRSKMPSRVGSRQKLPSVEHNVDLYSPVSPEWGRRATQKRGPRPTNLSVGREKTLRIDGQPEPSGINLFPHVPVIKSSRRTTARGQDLKMSLKNIIDGSGRRTKADDKPDSAQKRLFTSSNPPRERPCTQKLDQGLSKALLNDIITSVEQNPPNSNLSLIKEVSHTPRDTRSASTMTDLNHTALSDIITLSKAHESSQYQSRYQAPSQLSISVMEESDYGKSHIAHLKKKYSIVCSYSKALKDQYIELETEYQERVMYYLGMINGLNSSLLNRKGSNGGVGVGGGGGQIIPERDLNFDGVNDLTKGMLMETIARNNRESAFGIEGRGASEIQAVAECLKDIDGQDVRRTPEPEPERENGFVTPDRSVVGKEEINSGKSGLDSAGKAGLNSAVKIEGSTSKIIAKMAKKFKTEKAALEKQLNTISKHYDLLEKTHASEREEWDVAMMNKLEMINSLNKAITTENQNHDKNSQHMLGTIRKLAKYLEQLGNKYKDTKALEMAGSMYDFYISGVEILCRSGISESQVTQGRAMAESQIEGIATLIRKSSGPELADSQIMTLKRPQPTLAQSTTFGPDTPTKNR